MSAPSSGRRAAPRAARRGARTSGPARLVFTRRNYVLLGLALVLVIGGYALMRAENEVDGFLSLYVAPLLILGGYLEAIYAILWRPRTQPTP